MTQLLLSCVLKYKSLSFVHMVEVDCGTVFKR